MMTRFWAAGVLTTVLAATLTAQEPVVRWDFEPGAGRVPDLTGNGHDLTVVPERLGPGFSGQGLRLDGTWGVVLDPVPPLRGPRGFTVSCRIRSDMPPGPARNILTKDGEFMIRVDPDAAGGTISFYVWTDPEGWEPRARGPRLEPDRWYRLIASWDERTLRFLVDQTLISSPKGGRCPRTDGALRLGGPGPQMAGFQGTIDDVALAPTPLGPVTLTQRAYGIEPGEGEPRTDAHVVFAGTTDGWALGGGAEGHTGPNAWSLRFPDTRAYISVGHLALPEGTAGTLSLEAAVQGTRRLVVVLTGNGQLRELPVRVIPDGEMRRYTAGCSRPERWSGAVTGIAIYSDSRAEARIVLKRLALTPGNSSAPDLRIISAGPHARVNPLDTAVPFHCRVRNVGGPGRGGRVRLRTPSGVRVVSAPGPLPEPWPAGDTVDLRWELVSGKRGSGTVEVVLETPGDAPVAMQRPVIFFEDPAGMARRIARMRPWSTARYPRSMDFRHLTPGQEHLHEPDTVLLVDLIGDKLAAATAYKQRYPDRLVLMQVNDEPNGIWGSWHCVPREFADRAELSVGPDIFPMPSFRGYWLLGVGTVLPSAFPADTEALSVAVPDVERFIVSHPAGAPYRDCLLYALRDGEPDWVTSEYVSIREIDRESGRVVVERWAPAADRPWRAFDAGAVLAPSAGSVYKLPRGPWIQTWIPNLTSHCPRDPATGLDATEWWARHFARLWHTRIADKAVHPDGLQFDGLDEGRLADANRDGTLDACLFDGRNLWKEGLARFVHVLREGGDGWAGVGSAALLAIDASNVWGPAFPGLLNGSENEEFPSFAGPAETPTGLDLFLNWCALSRQPGVSYVQGRFACDSYRDRDWAQLRAAGKAHDDALVRMSIAGACMGSGIYAFRTGSRRDSSAILYQTEVLRYPWDEFRRGRDGVMNWLGHPLEPPQRLLNHLGEALIESAPGQWEGQAAADNCTVTAVTAVTAQPADARAFRIALTGQGGPRGPNAARRALLRGPMTQSPLQADAEYTLRLTIGATPGTPSPVPRANWQVPLGLALEASGRLGPPQWVSVGSERRELLVTLVAPAAGPGRPVILAGAGDALIRIESVALQPGCAEVIARRFEHGLALMNGSRQTAHMFDLRQVGGGRLYRRIDGQQAPDINNGNLVDGRLELAPSDGILLSVEPETVRVR